MLKRQISEGKLQGNAIFENRIGNEILTLPEVAERLKVSISGLRKVIRRSNLPYFKVGQQIRFCWKDVVNHFAQRS